MKHHHICYNKGESDVHLLFSCCPSWQPFLTSIHTAALCSTVRLYQYLLCARCIFTDSIQNERGLKEPSSSCIPWTPRMDACSISSIFEARAEKWDQYHALMLLQCCVRHRTQTLTEPKVVSWKLLWVLFYYSRNTMFYKFKNPSPPKPIRLITPLLFMVDANNRIFQQCVLTVNTWHQLKLKSAVALIWKTDHFFELAPCWGTVSSAAVTQLAPLLTDITRAWLQMFAFYSVSLSAWSSIRFLL